VQAEEKAITPLSQFLYPPLGFALIPETLRDGQADGSATAPP